MAKNPNTRGRSPAENYRGSARQIISNSRRTPHVRHIASDGFNELSAATERISNYQRLRQNNEDEISARAVRSQFAIFAREYDDKIRPEFDRMKLGEHSNPGKYKEVGNEFYSQAEAFLSKNQSIASMSQDNARALTNDILAEADEMGYKYSKEYNTSISTGAVRNVSTSSSFYADNGDYEKTYEVLNQAFSQGILSEDQYSQRAKKNLLDAQINRMSFLENVLTPTTEKEASDTTKQIIDLVNSDLPEGSKNKITFSPLEVEAYRSSVNSIKSARVKQKMEADKASIDLMFDSDANVFDGIESMRLEIDEMRSIGQIDDLTRDQFYDNIRKRREDNAKKLLASELLEMNPENFNSFDSALSNYQNWRKRMSGYVSTGSITTGEYQDALSRYADYRPVTSQELKDKLSAQRKFMEDNADNEEAKKIYLNNLSYELGSEGYSSDITKLLYAQAQSDAAFFTGPESQRKAELIFNITYIADKNEDPEKSAIRQEQQRQAIRAFASDEKNKNLIDAAMAAYDDSGRNIKALKESDNPVLSRVAVSMSDYLKVQQRNFKTFGNASLYEDSSVYSRANQRRVAELTKVDGTFDTETWQAKYMAAKERYDYTKENSGKTVYYPASKYPTPFSYNVGYESLVVTPKQEEDAKRSLSELKTIADQEGYEIDEYGRLSPKKYGKK